MSKRRWTAEEADICYRMKEAGIYTCADIVAELKRRGYDRTVEAVYHLFRGNIVVKNDNDINNIESVNSLSINNNNNTIEEISFSEEKETRKIINLNQYENFDIEQYLNDIIALQEKYYVNYDVRSNKDISKRKPIEFLINLKSPFAITFLADVHIGNKFCNYKLLLDVLNNISKKDNHFIYFGGDAIDNFVIPKLGRQTDKQLIEVEKQWQIVSYILTKYEKSILAVGDGNHESWSEKLAYVNLSKIFKHPNKFLYTGEDGVYINLICEGVHYKLHIIHKLNTGNSRLNRHLAHKRKYDFSSIPDIDVIVQEHYHEADMETFWRHGKKRLAINCGTFKMIDSYANKLSYEHVSNSTPTIVFYPDRYKMVYFEHYEDAQIYLDNLSTTHRL